jgi:hypothetical protein
VQEVIATHPHATKVEFAEIAGVDRKTIHRELKRLQSVAPATDCNNALFCPELAGLPQFEPPDHLKLLFAELAKVTKPSERRLIELYIEGNWT